MQRAQQHEQSGEGRIGAFANCLVERALDERGVCRSIGQSLGARNRRESTSDVTHVASLEHGGEIFADIGFGGQIVCRLPFQRFSLHAVAPTRAHDLSITEQYTTLLY